MAKDNCRSIGQLYARKCQSFLRRSWARLQNANLRGSILYHADLTGAKNLTQTQLDKACGDAKTMLDGLVRWMGRASGAMQMTMKKPHALLYDRDSQGWWSERNSASGAIRSKLRLRSALSGFFSLSKEKAA
ncbi:pentapeptide repeat-containing protein [Rhizobium leguminosarum]|uniref:pentapeptide repeat-containing protein n=1 Tax=Rhizobium leguminosarum TaxID=384 RepID=UPI003F958173